MAGRIPPMKTPAPVSKAIEGLTAAGAFLRRLLGQIFGNVSWQPPGWASRTGDRWSRLEQSYPRRIAPVVLAIFAIFCAGAWTWNWYSHLPKPHRVTVKITAPEVTKNEKDLKFPRLVVYFSESAARLADVKKPAAQGVELQPHLNGTWHWIKDDILVFEPTEDWPADQKFRVVFDKKFFPDHVRMESLSYDTQTPPFEIAIKKAELYQDPTAPTQRTVTATLELTHAVEPGELDRHIHFETVSGANLFPPNDPAPHFKVTYGLHKRIAYVQSSPIVLPPNDDCAKLILSKGVRTSQGGAQTKDGGEQKVQVPSNASMFKIDSIQTTIARNKNGEPEQLIVLTTTADINTRDLAKALEIRLLPKRKVSGAEQDAEVDSPEDSDQTPQESADSDNETVSSEESGGSQLRETELWKSAADVPDD